MNKKLLLLTMMFSMILSSCSKDSTVSPADNNDGIEKEYRARIKIAMPSVATKQPGEEFNKGTENENEVYSENSFIIFYSADKKPVSVLPVDVFTWQESNIDGNIARTGTANFYSVVKPKYLVCLLNINMKDGSSINPIDLKSMNLDQLKNFTSGNCGSKDNISKFYASSTSGFLMTNSSYIDTRKAPTSDNIVQEIVLTDDQIQEISPDAEYNMPTPINVYVERTVSKVTVKNNIINEVLFVNGEIAYSISNFVEPNDNNTSRNFCVKILGWTLNATNKTFAPLKNINNIATIQNDIKSFLGVNDNEAAYAKWISTDNYRTYWAIDNNYTSGNYLENSTFEGQTIPNEENISLNYYSLNDANNEFSNTEEIFPEYCFENTMSIAENNKINASTHVIIKAQYLTMTGETVANAYRLNRVIYSEAELKTYVKNHLENVLLFNGIDENDIVFERDNSNYKNRNDVKATIKYTGTVELTGYDKDNLNSIFGLNECWVYPEGICYYSIPISHYSIAHTTNPDVEIQLELVNNYYGVVRNHWYNVNLNYIGGFGHPADLDKPIVPEPITEKGWMIEADINILSWGIVNQDAVLDEDGMGGIFIEVR